MSNQQPEAGDLESVPPGLDRKPDFIVQAVGGSREAEVWIHRCSAREEIHAGVEGSDRPAPEHWGPAITAIICLDGNWWAITGEPPEYATPVRYCPWCAVRLDSLIDPVDLAEAWPDRIERLKRFRREDDVGQSGDPGGSGS